MQGIYNKKYIVTTQASTNNSFLNFYFLEK